MLHATAYGKSRVRLVQLTRRNDRHELCDLTIAIRFQGRYDESYTAGDNSAVLPTDTMKNTVYALAAAERIRHAESFGLVLARHFLDRNPRLEHVRTTSPNTRGAALRPAIVRMARRSCGRARTRGRRRSTAIAAC